MAATVTTGNWTPLPGALPSSVVAETVYVLPTREPIGNTGGVPRYTDIVRYVPRDARAAGASIEFSLPEGSREYLQEFSALEVWAIALAATSLVNDWLVLAVQVLIERRRRSEGWSEEQSEALPLKISIAKLDISAAVLETYQIEGAAKDALEAVRELRRNESDLKAPELEQ